MIIINMRWLHATATRKVEEIGIDLGKEALVGTPPCHSINHDMSTMAMTEFPGNHNPKQTAKTSKDR